MKRIFTLVIVALALLVTDCHTCTHSLREGDIVFQTYPSPQAEAIKIATRSQFSHVGMILKHNGRLMVYEAVGPVKFTPVDFWIDRNAKRHFVIKRLKNADSVLTSRNLAKLESVALTFKDKPYDSVFNWSDDEMYCSELVWKTFHRALNIDIGKLRKMKEFDLSSPEVRKILAERYPDGVPLEETVISPQDMYQSAYLKTICKQ
jgi:uncharacterized protein YycO